MAVKQLSGQTIISYSTSKSTNYLISDKLGNLL